ncbi:MULTISPECIES: S1 family serine peptidase [Actinokineospora]|uniref:Serine protease n=1 Tax=Actinokineospora fastidiosa TaxID=1816 RepID=A0A918GPT7_9PSEU|nr:MULTISPECIES: serine protease [Actinokineospora]UVS81180.1 Trypsin [Actinokineospora sp. UTMC 2448]GGS51839.1 serine protease [Actinokineospora fastidiosa]
MRRFWVALLTSALALVAPAAAADERIVGGEEVPIEDVPWTVSLQSDGEHRCGAVIVTETAVLTAAHCTIDVRPAQLTVRAGSSLHAEGGHVLAVAEVAEHPRYDVEANDFDVAIVRLSEPLPLGTAGVEAVEVATQTPSPMTPALVVGWGAISEFGDSPDHLRGVEVPIVDEATCQDSYGEEAISSRMLCAGLPEGGKDSCQGDSGGPLTAHATLVGLVSWGHGCARPRFYGIYTNIAHPGIRAWITEETGV